VLACYGLKGLVDNTMKSRAFYFPLGICAAVYSGWYIKQEGHAVALLVEALYYKPEGRGFDSSELFINIILPTELWPWG